MASVFTPLLAISQEWPRFRGPNGSGLSAAAEAIPTDLSAKSVRWKVALPGAGSSSPVLWGTKLFLTAEAGQEGQRQVLCFDATTGNQLWANVEPFKPYEHHNFNNFASSTPVCDAEHLYIAWTSGSDMYVIALTHDGKPVWQVNLGYYQEEHGSGASPVLVGKTLLVSKDHEGRDAFLVGLDAATGKEKWKLARKSDRTAFSTPLVISNPSEPGKKQVVYSSNPDALTCVDPETGKIAWEHRYGKPSKYRAVASPAEADGVILASVGQGGGGQAFAAVRVTDGKPEVAWEDVKGLPYVPTPVGKGEHFYVLNDGGNLSCIKAATGEILYKERVFNNAYSSPIIAGERLFCVSRTGEMAVIKTGPKFEKLGEGGLDEPCDSTPAIANGMLFIRTSKHLLAMGGADKKKAAGVSLELGTDTKEIVAGQPFRAALKFSHEPGYHTYWKSPGIAGIPMTLDWQLPAGWTASETLWAPPAKVYMGVLATHGYEKDTTLVWEITPPKTLAVGSQIHLPANLQWMCCAQRCHPGYAQLVLPLVVGTKAEKSAWAADIQTAVDQQPPMLAHWSLQAHREGKTIVLEGNSTQEKFPTATETTRFFGETTLICSNEPQTWTNTQQGFTAKLTVSTYVSGDESRLVGLIHHPTGWGYRRIDVAIR